MEPYNYAGIIGQGQQLVPNLLDQEIQRSLGRAQVDQAQANTALMRQKVAADQFERQQQEQYSQEVQAALESGDPRQISGLIARFPQFKDALKTQWDQMDTLKQRSEMREAVGTWSALNAGDVATATKMLETRIAADRQAGRDTSAYDDQLARLKSGDPKAVNSVKGELGLFMASVVPDKFASVVEQLGTGTEGGRKGQIVGRAIGHYDENGQFVVDYRDPEAFTLNEGQTRFQGGGGVPPSGGFESFYEGFLAPAEGGFVASDGRSGAPANFGVNQAANPDIDVRNLTRDQAKQIMHERYWKPSGADQISDPRLQAIHADTAVNMGVGRAKEFLAQSNGDPASYLALREQHYRRLGGKDLDGWLKRNSNLAQYAGMTGSQPTAVASVPKGAGQQAKRMTPQEVAAEGLDPNVVYYRGANGLPVPVQGQPKQGQAEKEGAYSQSALDAFDRAIDTAKRLGTHKGLSSAVGMKGLTGGLLGGWVVPGTAAADFNAELDAMKAQVFLPMVQSMKGMGALSNAEGEKLTAAIGALSTKQSETQFKASLNRIVKDLQTYKARGMPKGKQGGSGGPVRVRSIQEARRLAPGTVFIDPNGVRRVR